MSGLFQRLVPRETAEIHFTINGMDATARQGDTLLTAILLNYPALRRFEFADALRAGYCLMGACQDCWVTLTDGERRRACTTLVAPGMAAIIDD